MCFYYMYVQFRASEKKNRVADREATAFSIFYNNTLYFLLLLVLFWFMRTFHPVMYPFTKRERHRERVFVN